MSRDWRLSAVYGIGGNVPGCQNFRPPFPHSRMPPSLVSTGIPLPVPEQNGGPATQPHRTFHTPAAASPEGTGRGTLGQAVLPGLPGQRWHRLPGTSGGHRHTLLDTPGDCWHTLEGSPGGHQGVCRVEAGWPWVVQLRQSRPSLQFVCRGVEKNFPRCSRTTVAAVVVAAQNCLPRHGTSEVFNAKSNEAVEAHNFRMNKLNPIGHSRKTQCSGCTNYKHGRDGNGAMVVRAGRKVWGGGAAGSVPAPGSTVMGRAAYGFRRFSTKKK